MINLDFISPGESTLSPGEPTLGLGESTQKSGESTQKSGESTQKSGETSSGEWVIGRNDLIPEIATGATRGVILSCKK